MSMCVRLGLIRRLASPTMALEVYPDRRSVGKLASEQRLLVWPLAGRVRLKRTGQ